MWSHDLTKINDLHEIFQAILVALSKAKSGIPKRTELFRLIIIMSLLVKIMEVRWLPKLKNYLIERLCPAQTGFIPGQGVFTNSFRAMERIRMRTDNKKAVFALFIDFSSAYNHVGHDLLFQRLEGILDLDEIQFQRAIYDEIVIRSGKSSFRPNLGWRKVALFRRRCLTYIWNHSFGN